MGTYTCERCEKQSPDQGDFVFSDDKTVSFCLDCAERAMDNGDITAEAVVQSIVDLGAEGHEMLIEALSTSWTDTTKGLLKTATPPLLSNDTEDIITDMLQVSMAMAVSSALSSALLAIRKYNLTLQVVEQLHAGGVCDHPECKVLRQARANPDNN